MLKDIILSIITIILSIIISIKTYNLANIDGYKKGNYFPTNNTSINRILIFLLLISYINISMSNYVLKLTTTIIFCTPLAVLLFISHKYYLKTKKRFSD